MTPVRAGVDLRVLDNPAQAAVDLLARHAAAGHQIALTGGSTPKAAYERAAQLDVDWGGATLWYGDDRCVPPDDPNSNHGMAKAALLDRIRGPAPEVHRIRGELGPQAGADDYLEQLRGVFGEGTPALDLILLGLGPDGHCASMFPGKPAVQERERLVVGVPEAGLEPFVPRVTFTLPLLDAGREVVFLVSGESKAQAAARAWGGDPDIGTPASLVASREGTLTVLIDPPAAELLDP